MKTRFTWIKILGVFAIALGAATIKVAAANVTATLEPSSITLGESAQLSVTVDGSDNGDPVLPTVSGLEFTPGGQSSSFQSINGTVTASVSVLYQVTPDRAGTFTIPPIRLAGGGSSQPLILQVLKRSGNASASPYSYLPPPNVQAGAPDDTANAKGEMAFLRVTLPKRELFVGQLVPVEVKAYFRAGMAASLNGLPSLSSDAFTLNKLGDKPDQSQETVGGRPYTVLTWSSALSAVKAGDYALDLELPVVVRLQEHHRRVRNPMRQFFGSSPFDDSFFDDPVFDDFFGNVTEKQLTLHTGSDPVKVLPLPATGRPADFDGAVGQFEVSNEVAPTQSAQGDPITVRLNISGRGNFDRVISHGLATSPEWKTYQPSAHFEPADTAGYEGTKTFEQAVVPFKAGSVKIPAITFSYFDPDARQYVTRATTPIAVSVSPGSNTPMAATPPASPTTSSPTRSENPASPDLAVNKIESGNFVSSLRPVLFAPWFVAWQGMPILMLAVGLAFYRRRERLARDPQRVRDRVAQSAVRGRLQAMEQALAANNAPAFFTAARQAVREQLACRWHLSATQVTPVEINRRLNGDGNELRNLFAVADDVVYSGRSIAPADLKHWNDQVILQIKKLENS